MRCHVSQEYKSKDRARAWPVRRVARQLCPGRVAPSSLRGPVGSSVRHVSYGYSYKTKTKLRFRISFVRYFQLRVGRGARRFASFSGFRCAVCRAFRYMYVALRCVYIFTTLKSRSSAAYHRRAAAHRPSLSVKACTCRGKSAAEAAAPVRQRQRHPPRPVQNLRFDSCSMRSPGHPSPGMRPGNTLCCNAVLGTS